MNIEIDFNEAIKEAFEDTFEHSDFLDCLSEDISRSNPEWWAEHVATPIKEELIKEIQSNEAFRKELVYTITNDNDLVEYAKKYLREQIDKIVEVFAKEILSDLTKDIKGKLSINLGKMLDN
jgi:malonyl CoA-acyl carrier protein transacylase